MKTLLSLVSVVIASVSVASSDDRYLEVTNRRPLKEVENLTGLRTYANANDYYRQVKLREGMKLSFSASYGMGKENAQARGTLVQRDGRFYFKQEANPSMNLLLPPGLSHGAKDRISLWDVGAYMDLINRVAFGERNEASQTDNEIYGAPEASLVDFSGGTAGDKVSYRDAMEVSFSRTVDGRSDSHFKAYYAKGVGPVSAEFRENKFPDGTFKFFIR